MGETRILVRQGMRNVKRPTSNIEPMRILMISAEGPPLQRAGALVDVMDALPAALRARGHDVSVALAVLPRNSREPRIQDRRTPG